MKIIAENAAESNLTWSFVCVLLLKFEWLHVGKPYGEWRQLGQIREGGARRLGQCGQWERRQTDGGERYGPIGWRVPAGHGVCWRSPWRDGRGDTFITVCLVWMNCFVSAELVKYVSVMQWCVKQGHVDEEMLKQSESVCVLINWNEYFFSALNFFNLKKWKGLMSRHDTIQQFDDGYFFNKMFWVMKNGCKLLCDWNFFEKKYLHKLQYD